MTGNGVPVPVVPPISPTAKAFSHDLVDEREAGSCRPLVIAPLVSSLLDLDFILAASNLVDRALRRARS